MRYDVETHTVTVSRRNLEALLRKLNINQAAPGTSACTILGGRGAEGLTLKAEENDEHYENLNRAAGMMHPHEEIHISKPSTGVL